MNPLNFNRTYEDIKSELEGKSTDEKFEYLLVRHENLLCKLEKCENISETAYQKAERVNLRMDVKERKTEDIKESIIYGLLFIFSAIGVASTIAWLVS